MKHLWKRDLLWRQILIVKQLPVGAIQTNCYIVGCEETHEGVVIDPGDEGEMILAEVNKEGLTIKYILNTHAHFDHILANAALVRATGAPLAIHPLELPMLRSGGGASAFGLPSQPSPRNRIWNWPKVIQFHLAAIPLRSCSRPATPLVTLAFMTLMPALSLMETYCLRVGSAALIYPEVTTQL
jgi:hypothetical protein